MKSIHWPLLSRSGVPAAIAVLLCLGTAKAAPIFFTDSASFQAAAPASLSVQGFDSVPSGTPVPEGTPFQGITFGTNLPGLGLMVSNALQTISNPNYLGVENRQDNAFLSGDEVIFSMGPVSAFGLFLIASPGDVLANDFQLVAAGGSVFNVDTPEQILSGGREVFFLGLVDPDTFTSAQLISFGDPDDPFFSYQIDEIASSPIPEPATFALLGLGLVLLALLRPRRSRRAVS